MFPARKSGHAILGLDPGTKLGWSLHKPDMTVTSGTLILPDLPIGSPARGKKTEALRRFLAKAHKDAGGLHGIYYELSKFIVARQVLAVMDRGGLVDMICAFGWYSGVPCYGVPPTTLKKFATGTGKAKKEDMKFAVESWGFRPVTYDEADAIAVMSWGLEQCDGLAKTA